MTTCHSLPLVVIRGHPLLLIFIHWRSLYQSLPFVVPVTVTCCHSLSLVESVAVTRYITRYFHKRLSGIAEFCFKLEINNKISNQNIIDIFHNRNNMYYEKYEQKIKIKLRKIKLNETNLSDENPLVLTYIVNIIQTVRALRLNCAIFSKNKNKSS